jgi:chromosome segregation ATPase
VSVCCCTPSPAQVIALAESAGPSGVEQALLATQEQATDLQRQLAEADGVRRGLEKELARARKQLSDEQSERNTLEEHMITRLEDMGDEVAQVGAHVAQSVCAQNVAAPRAAAC